MEYPIPEDRSVDTRPLSNVFKNTTATYKYYWFLSILDEFVKDGKRRFSIWEVVIGMVSLAWYPVHYFRLSFGRWDSMYTGIKQIQTITGLPIDADARLIQKKLKEELKKGNVLIQDQLKVFTQYVPYCFLSPWLHESNKSKVIALTQDYSADVPYKIEVTAVGGMDIVINDRWADYLTTNYQILKDFTYWNLANFLQGKNPNVPNIPQKLIRPDSRKSLARQHKFWNTIIEATGPIHCIYTGNELYMGAYDLDHFIPWSFVTHDMAWNLMPSNPSINSSKSDKIPDLDIYLPKMALAHQSALNCYVELGHADDKILEDYLSLGFSLQDLLSMNNDAFYDVFQKTFRPIAQIATNMGFEPWQYHK